MTNVSFSAGDLFNIFIWRENIWEGGGYHQKKKKQQQKTFEMIEQTFYLTFNTGQSDWWNHASH